MRLMTRVVFAEILEESCVSLKKRLKVACPACFVLSLLLPPGFLWRMGTGNEGGWGRGGDRRRRRHRPTGRRARKNKCESAKCVVGVPVRRSVVWSFIRPFARSFSYSRRAIKITRFAGRNAGAAPGGLNPSSLYESMACRQREAKTVSGSGGK